MAENANGGNGNRGALAKFVKKLGRLEARALLREIELLAYTGQLEVERKLLLEGGHTWEEASNFIEHWKPALANFHSSIDELPNGFVWYWGAASSRALNVPGAEIIVRMIEAIAEELICGINIKTGERREAGIIHGSSQTGFMGVGDRAWATSRERSGCPSAPIGTIALNWITDEVRETPTLNARREHRHPPAVRIEDRTPAFANKRPRLILTAPCGLGGRFEIYWALLSGQLREMLLTCFTGWRGPLPYIVLLDYFMDPNSVADERIGGLGKMNGEEKSDVRFGELEGFEDLKPAWAFDGFLADLRQMVLCSTISREDVSRVRVVRIGDGKSTIGPNRFGPEVVYFPNVEDAAKDIGLLFDEADFDQRLW